MAYDLSQKLLQSTIPTSGVFNKQKKFWKNKSFTRSCTQLRRSTRTWYVPPGNTTNHSFSTLYIPTQDTSYASKGMYSIIQDVPAGRARLRENVPYIKVHRSNPKHLHPKLNGYGDNGEKKVAFLQIHVLYLFRVLLPVHCTCPSFSLTAKSSTFHLHYQEMSQLQ